VLFRSPQNPKTPILNSLNIDIQNSLSINFLSLSIPSSLMNPDLGSIIRVSE